MRAHKALESDDAKEAQWEAARGAAVGAVKWGAASAVLGGLGYAFSPLYRSLTVQFKVYLQMSGMIVGSMIEADYRMRQYEQRIRMQRRIAQNRAVWADYEKELMELQDEGASSQQNRK
ncbi:hypothetical protein F5Y00DRAFT_258696 [Daldinia vernicosa]|uniref:uncharacterized protein n=1 Tax=Daldinia vernicosa TaxID=114800 RepID=UPI002008BC3F|nr:uncharacterized protein F5Y00DRAFT_258696 [Daldinia vernicosa]KAI0852289.1 hypothetical protein F5Y00DRAFT_258696 [Daldinia vernicosa]